MQWMISWRSGWAANILKADMDPSTGAGVEIFGASRFCRPVGSRSGNSSVCYSAALAPELCALQFVIQRQGISVQSADRGFSDFLAALSLWLSRLPEYHRCGPLRTHTETHTIATIPIIVSRSISYGAANSECSPLFEQALCLIRPSSVSLSVSSPASPASPQIRKPSR